MKSISLFLLAITACGADAALLAYEGFSSPSYTSGSALSGQGAGSGTGFSGNWHAPTLNSVSNSYWASSGGSPSANNSAIASAGQASYQTSLTGGVANQVSIQRNFSSGAPAPNNLFVSTLVTIDGSSAVSLGFGSVLSGDQGAGRPFQFGFQENGALFAKGNSTGNPVFTGGTYASGTYWLVAELVNDGTGNDTIRVWVNPTIGTPLGTQTLTYNAATAGTATNFYVGSTTNWSIDGVVLDFKSTGTLAGTTSVDEIRIGNTFADVIPEPSMAILSFLGLGVFFGRRAR